MVLKSLILSLILKSSVSFVIRRIKYYLFIYSFIYLFTILQAFPLYKAYMLGFGQVRKGS